MDLNICFLDEKSSSANDINSRFRSLAKGNIQKLMSVLHPQLKRTLLDCLRKNNILFHVSGEEGGSKIWDAKYLGSLYIWNAPRRHLGARLLESSDTPSPAGPPISSPMPSPDPVPSPAPVPSSSPAPNPQSPAVGLLISSPTPSPDSTFQPPANNHSSGSPSNSKFQENKQSNNHKSVVIAVAVTASVTFVVVALFFLCCTKICGKGSRARQNDERPLLSLSLNDFSVGMLVYISLEYLRR